MKRLSIRFILTIIAFFFFCNSYSQIKDVANMLSGIDQAPEDVNKLFQGYISPYANVIGANLNAGWYNTAKIHKLGGFDITATFNIGFIPDEDKTFDLSTLNLTGTVEGDPIAPTAGGSRDAGSTVAYYETVNVPTIGDQQFKLAEFRTPQGTGLGFLPTPMVQLGLGLIKGTEILGRYMPTISLGKSGEIGLWGIGVKHSLKQWIPVFEKIPILHLSVMGGYTKLTSKFGLSFLPEDLSYTGITAIDNTTNAVNFENQEMLFNIKSFTASILVSANLPVVCFYGGLGFATTNTNLKLSGDYPTPVPYIEGTSVGIQVTDESVVTDPIDIKIKNKEGGTTKPRYNVGMRIKMGVVTFHGDYTYSSYSIASAGIGISFR